MQGFSGYNERSARAAILWCGVMSHYGWARRIGSPMDPRLDYLSGWRPRRIERITKSRPGYGPSVGTRHRNMAGDSTGSKEIDSNGHWGDSTATRR